MALTGQLGTANSGLGKGMVPALGSLPAAGAKWVGPFSPNEMTFQGCQMDADNVIFPPGIATVAYPGVQMTPFPLARIVEAQRVILPARIATGAYLADPEWWVFG